MEISSLLQDPNPNQRNAAKGLVSKWERTGLLEGLNSETERAGMAQLLENQARQLVREQSVTGTAQNSEEWSGVALPLVRRIFAEFAAKEFVSVQPMNLPSGLVFYLDFKYGTAQPGFTTTGGTSNPIPFGSPNADNSMFGVTSDSGDPSGGLYGAGRFAYSINEVSASVSASITDLDAVSAAAASASVNYNSAFTNLDLSQYKLITVATGSMAASFDPTAVRSFIITTGSGATLTQYPAFTKLSGGDIQFVMTASTGAWAGTSYQDFVLSYNLQPTDITRGDFEDQDPFTGTAKKSLGINQGTDIDIPQVNLEMQSDPIVAKTRKLKAVWTPEFAQDLNAYHSIDAEAELTSMLSEYVSMEIDLEILDMLINGAVTTEYWSAQGNYIWDGVSNFTQKSAGAGGWYNTQGEWFQTLGTKLQKVSNIIHQKTLRGGANFLVTSPAVATILESIPGFAANTDGDKQEFAAGVQKIGAMNNRYTVYKNPYMLENVILMGYRGAQFLETGAVYSPYVPLIMTPLVYDPVNFTPRKGVMTRYAKKIVRPEFYGKVYVHGLNSL
jgi:hypothetical protein